MTLTVAQSRFAAIDFESAGVAKGATDCPIQVGLATWTPGSGPDRLFVSYLHTDHPVLWSAQRVHGISADDLRDAPDMLSLWPEFRSRLQGSVVVAHGKGTEKRFLRAFPGHGFGPWLDTLLLSRAIWPELPDHSLSALCDSLGVTDRIHAIVCGRTWHDALFDAVASILVLETAINTLELHDVALASILQPDTSPWHRSRSM